MPSGHWPLGFSALNLIDPWNPCFYLLPRAHKLAQSAHFGVDRQTIKQTDKQCSVEHSPCALTLPLQWYRVAELLWVRRTGWEALALRIRPGRVQSGLINSRRGLLDTYLHLSTGRCRVMVQSPETFQSGCYSRRGYIGFLC